MISRSFRFSLSLLAFLAAALPAQHRAPSGSDPVVALIEEYLGERPAVGRSEHFRIVTMYGEEQAEELVQLAEEVYATFTELIRERPNRRYWSLTADLFFLSSRGQYQTFLEKIAPRYIQDKAMLDFARKGGGLMSTFPPFAVDNAERSPIRNYIVNAAAQQLLDNYVGPRRRLPAWLLQGFGMYMEYRFEKSLKVIWITRRYYGGDVKLAQKASDPTTWPELIKNSVIDGTHTPFVKLKHIMLNELDFEHLSKSWSLVTFLVDEHPEKFARWAKNMRRMLWEEAFYKAYGWTNEELDRRWEEWVKITY